MDKLYSLDNRLQLCASLVRPSARLADVGTDHAYLPVWLLKHEKISYAIASDINSGPLESGRANAQKYGAESIAFRLGAGLSTISADDRITDVVIAGMGGEIIAQIIADSELTHAKDLNLILQPMTKSEELIAFLCKNGFEIREQKCTESHGKCYTVILASYCGKAVQVDDVFPYVGKLDLSDEHSALFLRNQIKHLENKSKGDEKYLPILNELKKLVIL